MSHHAISEAARGGARNLHMPPSVIGSIAEVAGMKQVVLSHRMLRILGREAESEHYIREHYTGALVFIQDGQCFSLLEKFRSGQNRLVA